MTALAFKIAYFLHKGFWPLWLAILVGTVSFGCFLRERAAAEVARRPSVAPKSRLDRAALAAFLALVALYVAAMFWREAFAYQDNFMFTDTTAVGGKVPPPIWLEAGRLFPLAYQEYNFLAHLSATPACYFAFAALELVLGLALVVIALRCDRWWPVLASLSLLLFAPAFIVNFMELEYPERNIVFCLCVLAFAVERYDRTHSTGWLILALASSQVALYYKEASVALLGVFVTARLSLRVQRRGFRSLRESGFELAVLLQCAAFVALLLIVLRVRGTSEYVATRSIGFWRSAAHYALSDALALALVVTVTAGVALTVAGRHRAHPLWDTLALGGAVHAVAIAATGLTNDYYMAPAELIAALVLARLAVAAVRGTRDQRWALGFGALALAAGTLPFGLYRAIERKNVVVGNRALADFLLDHARSHDANVRLYFPAAQGYRIMNFASYLSSRGLPLPVRGGEQRVSQGVTLAGPRPFEDGLCIPYGKYLCRQELTPRPGDLLVYLPEDLYRDTPRAPPAPSAQVFDFEPVGLPSGPRWLLDRLFLVCPVYDHRPLPEDWLHIRVYRALERS